MHNWTDDEIGELLRATVFDEDCWRYCPVSGTEISPIEPEADETWGETCNAKVKVEGVSGLGYS